MNKHKSLSRATIAVLFLCLALSHGARAERTSTAVKPSPTGTKPSPQSWQFSNTVRDGLHPRQYYALAKYFLSDFDLPNAQLCVRKLKAMSANKEAADFAFRLEDTLMPKYPPPKEALDKFRNAVHPRVGRDNEQVCTDLIKQFPKFEWPYAVQSVSRLNFDEASYQKRIPLLKKIIEINPHNVQALLALTDIEHRRQHRTEALKYFDLAKKYNREIAETDCAGILEPPDNRELKERLSLQAQSRVRRREQPNPIPFDASKLPKQQSYRFIDKSGAIAFRVGPNVKTADHFSDGLLLINGSEERGSYQSEDVQFWNKNGDLVFNIDYGDAGSFSEGLCAVQRDWFDDMKIGWGYFDKTGKPVITASAFEAKPFHEGLAAIKAHRGNDHQLPMLDFGEATYGFIDKSGSWKAEPIYTDVEPFTEGLASVSVSGKIGYINKNGLFVIPPLYDVARPFSEGLANVTIVDEATRTWDDQYIDKTGKIVFREKSTIPGDRPLRQWYENGVLNSYGHRILTFPGDKDKPKVWDFHNGLVVTEQNGKRGYKNKAGKIVITPQFDKAFEFSAGLARVQIKDRFGFIDTTGKLVVPARFKDARNFSDGLACVTEDGRLWGFIDSKGSPVIKPIYTEAYSFSCGLAKVGVDK